MTQAIFERNILALSRVDAKLAEVLLNHGGHVDAQCSLEPLRLDEAPISTEIVAVGPFAPAQLEGLLRDGHRVKLYCESLTEVVGMLSHCDLRVSIFSGALTMYVGAWQLAFEDHWESGDLRSATSHARIALWASRSKRLKHQSKVLVLDGGLFVDDIGEALESLGYCPLLMQVDGLPQELWPGVTHADINRVVSVNDRHGIEALGLSLRANVIVWQIDPDLDEGRNVIPDNLFLGWYRPLTSTKPNIRYMPLGSNCGRRNPSSEKPFRLSFVGSSMVETSRLYLKKFTDLLLSRGVELPSIQARIRDFTKKILLTETGGYHRRDVLEHFSELGNGIIRSDGRDLGIDAVMWLGEYLASRWRLHVVSSVSAPLDVWGDEGWASLTDSAIRFHGPCGHGAPLNQVYAESLISLDIGRIYQPDIVTMRVFDVLASNRFVLTPDNPAVRELFEVGSEIATYDSIADLNAKIAFFRANPEEARQIAERGHQRVVSDHQIVRRIDEMMRWSDANLSQ